MTVTISNMGLYACSFTDIKQYKVLISISHRYNKVLINISHMYIKVLISTLHKYYKLLIISISRRYNQGRLTVNYRYTQGVRSERRTHGGNKCKHTRARDVTRDNLAKNSL